MLFWGWGMRVMIRDDIRDEKKSCGEKNQLKTHMTARRTCFFDSFRHHHHHRFRCDVHFTVFLVIIRHARSLTWSVVRKRSGSVVDSIKAPHAYNYKNNIWFMMTTYGNHVMRYVTFSSTWLVLPSKKNNIATLCKDLANHSFVLAIGFSVSLHQQHWA